MTLTSLSLDKFVEATASGAPVPGGGSISALCGALSAALATMVARLTLGKKKYADVQPRIQQLIDTLADAPADILRSVDLDSEAYDQVFKAYKLPKDTDDEKDHRNECIQKALKMAASVPLTVACSAVALFPFLKEIAAIGNKNAITDVYVAAQCARAAALGAAANVRINLQSISDEEFVAQAIKDVTLLENEAIASEEVIRQSILNEIQA